MTKATSLKTDVAIQRRDFIRECAIVLGDLSAALADAACRGDDDEAEVRLRQIVLATKSACQTFREMRPASDERRAAA
ncbi:MAG: hypothetical protein ACR65T_12860 [Methylocystis sp.]|uniref:hypothetical protein n=1 Tax=Methylocystis sp. TaxID=1911079 RepID=UPI003DA3AC1B